MLKDIAYRVFYRPSDNPLESFYLPTLAASVYYDRSAGYFRSSALAAAAAGVARLIANGGRMRLLVGAELSEDDVEAIRKGYDLRERVGRVMVDQLQSGEIALDGPLQQRLDALTWMVANGTLDIKVVLPLGRDGFPIAGPQAHEYYHAKKGIFTDVEGNQVGFVGSVNESGQAWKYNFEEFSVYCSWEGERDRAALGQLRASFSDLWEGRDDYWLAIELPEAVRRELIRRAPPQPPAADPLELPRPAVAKDGEGQLPYATVTDEERLLFQFVRDAPHLLNAGDLGAATSTVNPWPHQLQVARTIIDRYPDRALLCDEVGLGKTIEAGLIIRQLILSGQVKRCLILTPAAISKQWQEELYEKFNLQIPRYDRGILYGVDGKPIGPPLDDPWAECDLLLATSHLAKRKERVPQLLAAAPWDLLVVDEAHHARRKDFLQPRRRPNSLLTLLDRLKEADQYRALLLMTATPMQVNPVEVWDLLTILGIGGRWGADENEFLGFFNELRRPVDEIEWEFVYDLVADYLKQGGHAEEIDPHFYRTMQAAIGTPHANAIRDLPQRPGQRKAIIRSLPPSARVYASEMARRHTPLKRTMFRNTRPLLRHYIKKGILRENVPYRRPTIRRVRFLPEEEALYERIDDYITNFYAKYEEERRGLGFIMTVYRRRLTSSFYAVRRSLERRRAWLLGQLEVEEAFTLEDEIDLDELDELEQEGLDLHGMDPQQPLTPGQKALFQAELDYLDSFIIDLQALSDSDSKTNALKDELSELFRKRPTVIIFTQYADTMDYLREQLQTVYRGQIACYSGRGGEVWQGMSWLPTTKEDVKTRFREGEFKILLATESASEGLNLQTCGMLINYDMPWNPMRVEQRIGRIDRIGQQYEEVWIYNYFYRDTIEDRVYQALKNRIDWFETVVGALQPILAEVNKVTRDLAMLPAERREAEFQEAIRRLEEEIDRAKVEALDLDQYVEQTDPAQHLQTPVTLADLEQLLTQSGATGRYFQPHPEIERSHMLTWQGQHVAVTFSAEMFDKYPDTLRFLSYGSPLLTEILSEVGEIEEYPSHLVRFARDDNWPLCGWYDLQHPEPRSVESLADLRWSLKGSTANVTDERSSTARKMFDHEVESITRAYQQRQNQHRQQQRAILQAKAARLLQRAALVEIALGQQRSLFETEAYPTGFNQEAVTGLQRHGAIWQWMIVIASNSGKTQLPLPEIYDPFYEQVRHHQPEQLKLLFGQLAEEARPLVKAWQRLS